MYSLKDLQGYVDLMKLLTALLDVLEPRYHEISAEKNDRTRKHGAYLRNLSGGSSKVKHISQFLVESCLAARLKVAHDDSQLSNILDKLLQVFFEVIELFRHCN